MIVVVKHHVTLAWWCKVDETKVKIARYLSRKNKREKLLDCAKG